MPVRLQNGTLAVFSPTALTTEVRDKVTELGDKVGYLAATDYEHHIFLSEWAKAYPSAKILGVDGLPEKREKSKETAGTKFHHVWTMKNKHDMAVDPDFDQEFETEYVGSHGNKELVFCHKPDKTLIEADLIFNLPANEQYSKAEESPTSGIGTKMFVGLMKCYLIIIGWYLYIIFLCIGHVILLGGKESFRRLWNGILKPRTNEIYVRRRGGYSDNVFCNVENSRVLRRAWSTHTMVLGEL